MAKKAAKRRGGRPATGVRPFTGARFSAEVLDEIDRFAKRQKFSRSEAIRQLVTRGLAELKS
jgi:hypothetical protein